MQYDVRLVALANVSAIVTVDSVSEEEAEKSAIQAAKEGGALWCIDNIAVLSSIQTAE